MSRRRGTGWPVWFIVWALFGVAFWGGVFYVAWHFIAKWW